MLVNRHPAVVEYLGEDYPFFFDDLEQAARLADDPDAVHAAHSYLSALPKERFTQEAFLHAFVQSTVYAALGEHPGDEDLSAAKAG